MKFKLIFCFFLIQTTVQAQWNPTVIDSTFRRGLLFHGENGLYACDLVHPYFYFYIENENLWKRNKYIFNGQVNYISDNSGCLLCVTGDWLTPVSVFISRDLGETWDSIIIGQLKVKSYFAFYDSKANIYVGTEKGLLLINKEKEYCFKDVIKDQKVTSFCKTDSTMLFCCSNGLYRFYISSEKVEGVRTIPKDFEPKWIKFCSDEIFISSPKLGKIIISGDKGQEWMNFFSTIYLKEPIFGMATLCGTGLLVATMQSIYFVSKSGFYDKLYDISNKFKSIQTIALYNGKLFAVFPESGIWYSKIGVYLKEEDQ